MNPSDPGPSPGEGWVLAADGYSVKWIKEPSMTIQEMVAVLEAAGRGEPIESRPLSMPVEENDNYDGFKPDSHPTWDFERYEYRVDQYAIACRNTPNPLNYRHDLL